MPVVLFTTDKPRSGHVYDDRTGVAYEYPSPLYDKYISTGDRFVYVRPRAGYSGTGVIGDITASGNPGHRVCDILDYQPFDRPVGLKAPNGEYYELDPRYWTDNVYWGQGVRPLSGQRLEAILAAASAMAAPA